jgi:hypothetical protein
MLKDMGMELSYDEAKPRKPELHIERRLQETDTDANILSDMVLC